jgi:hypothetical protein
MLHILTQLSERLLSLLVLLSLCLIPLYGCSSDGASAQDDAQLRATMTLLGLQYGTYLSEKGAPPPDEPGFREYLQSRMAVLGDYGVKSADDLLRQGRDGQPFKVNYGIKNSLPERPEYVWAAYEQNGVAGMRLACDSRGGVHEITDVEYAQLFAAK